MTASRRIIAMLTGAVVLPTLIFFTLQIAFGYRLQQANAESATLDRAQAIIDQIDARLERIRGAVDVMTTIRSLSSENWPEAYERVRKIKSLDTIWRSVRLIDVARGVEVFDSARPLGEPLTIDPDKSAELAALRAPSVGGIVTEGGTEVSLSTPVMRDGAVRFVFVLHLAVDDFQAIALSRAAGRGLAAVVDRDGRFIARTLNFAERAGRPATQFVRDAVRGGTRGIYKGVTYEGLVNYTAFATSPATGWSAHVAVSTSTIDAPFRRSLAATAIAAMVSLALALAFVWFVLRTIRSQRAAAERLQSAERMEAVGKLAGGIAHDFNNMLAIVIGSLDLAKRRLATGRDVGRHLDAAADGARRAADLTRKMLAFSRRQSLAPAPVDVNALVANMRDLLLRTIESNVAIETKQSPGLWPIFVDPAELENAIVNLAVNARDAMPNGGVLTISTENVGAAQAAGLAGDHVVLSVADTGVGMSAEVADRAFEPFFSTKPTGRGTGLGLSQIHGFALQSGGAVEICSEPGRGTTITLRFPRYLGSRGVGAAVRARSGELPRGTASEVILVVEDEYDVRFTTVEALRELGYGVLHAQDGEAGLEALRSNPTVAMLLTDIVMPRLGGRELAALAREIAPQAGVLFTTGYDRGVDVDVAEGELLRKPYLIEDLARAVRRTLDRAQEQAPAA